MTPSSETSSRKRYRSIAPFVFLAVISIVLAIAIALLLQQLFQYRALYEKAAIEMTMAGDETEALLIQLNELDDAFRKLMTDHTALVEQLAHEREQIQNLRNQIRRGGTTGEVAEYRARIEQLEAQLIEYQDQVELLMAENRAMSGENAQIRTALNHSREEKSHLEQQKELLEQKVKEASVLRISGLEILPVRDRKRGDQQTSRATRVDKILFCFSINENPVAQPGNKEFFFRITGPLNQVLGTNAKDLFEYQGEQINYTFRHEASFANNEKHLCAEWMQDGYDKGLYHVSVFNQGVEISHGHFELD